MGYATGAGLDPVPERANTVFPTTTPIAPDPCYSYPIDLGTRVFLKLGIDFTKGSLTNIILTLQIWDGSEWIDDYGADGSTRWTVTLSADTEKSILIGDVSGTIESPVPCAWRFARIKVDPTGTNTSSSLTLRAAAK